tara:strand:- start:213 stop:974 length:762 start_codon:yes stop_codon:yes gene_type:complete
MATFVEHIEAATGLSISGGDSASRPNSNDLKIFLREGIKDVINNVLRFSPGSADLFAIESDRKQNSDNFKINSGVILEIMRERAADEWRPCRQVPVSKQYLVTDVDSFDYASAYNPVFVRDSDNVIKVFPNYTTSESSLGFKVRYIDFSRYDSEHFDIHATTDLESPGIKGFPSMFIPHLIAYGSIKCITEYHYYILSRDEDVELASGYLNTLKELKDNYDSMFLTKDVMLSAQQRQQQQQQQQQPRRTRRRS